MIGNVDHFVNRQILLWQEERKIARLVMPDHTVAAAEMPRAWAAVPREPHLPSV